MYKLEAPWTQGNLYPEISLELFRWWSPRTNERTNPRIMRGAAKVWLSTTKYAGGPLRLRSTLIAFGLKTLLGAGT